MGRHQDSGACGDRPKLGIQPATWEGVKLFVKEYYPKVFVKEYYPKVYQDMELYTDEMKTKAFDSYEKEAGFQFIQSRRAEFETVASPYYSYDVYCSLPYPRSCWQLRLFLYCELRLLETFTGNGYTHSPRGEVGCQEVCPNLALSSLDDTKYLLLPLQFTVPS